MAKLTRRQKTVFLFVTLFVYALSVGLLIRDRYVNLTGDVTTNETAPRIKPPSTEDVVLPPVQQALPASFDIKVPFLVQAPFGNWDSLHQETCEEASLMMVKYFLDGRSFESLEAANEELIDLVGWQTDHGYKVDVAVAELGEIARRYYSLTTARIIEDPTVEDIKREVAAGRPVIVPAAGRELDNPYFTAGGPPYHMVVVRGYTDGEFIVNDPGTRRGEAFRYSHDNLMHSMHDWHGTASQILLGRKAVLVFDS
jgi:hypothetical protein